MKKIGLSWNIFFVLSLLGLLMLLAPMIKAAQYDVPSEDDYPYGLAAHQTWARTGSFREVLKTAVSVVKDRYITWQGTFSAIFLFSMNPLIFGEQYYRYCPLIIMSMLILGNFILTFTVGRGIFKASRSQSGILAVILTVICTQFLPRASQGIYWYNGAVYYTFFYGLAEIALSILIRYILRDEGQKGIGKLIIASILLFFIGGGNLVTGLTTSVLLVTMEVLLVLQKKSDWKALMLPVLLFFIGFIINVSAPGNSERQRYFSQPGIVKAVFLSFQQAGIFFIKWFTIPVIALILMTVPVLLNIARKTDFQFKYPALVTLYSICLAGVMFYAPIYAMTEHNLQNLGRILNIIFFGEVFLVTFNLFYWIGWLIQQEKLPEKYFPATANEKYSLVFLCVMLLLFAFGMTQIQWFDTTSISAFRSYRSGEMGNYWHTYQQRLEILQNPEIQDAVLKRFPYRPYVLFYRELSASPNGNVNVARWYGKNSVIIQ